MFPLFFCSKPLVVLSSDWLVNGWWLKGSLVLSPSVLATPELRFPPSPHIMKEKKQTIRILQWPHLSCHRLVNSDEVMKNARREKDTAFSSVNETELHFQSLQVKIVLRSNWQDAGWPMFPAHHPVPFIDSQWAVLRSMNDGEYHTVKSTVLLLSWKETFFSPNKLLLKWQKHLRFLQKVGVGAM